MKLTAKDLVHICTTKTSTFKSSIPEIEGRELTIKQLTISQSDEYSRKLKESNQFEAICFAVKCSMVEPSYFSDEEFAEIGKVGKSVIYEVFGQIPYIGMSEEEKTEYDNKLNELLNVNEEKELVKKEDTEKK